MKARSLLKLSDLQNDEIHHILDLAAKMKASPVEDGEGPLKGKVAGLIFEKPSTRTRVSFEVGVIQLGGAPLYFSAKDLQLGRGEPIPDTARVLSRYLDLIVARTHSHGTLEDLRDHGTIPVVNGLSDRFHPCQAMADLQTIREVAGELQGISLAYVGDGNNVCHSLLLAAGKTGMDIRVAAPEGYAPAPEVVEEARGAAAVTGGEIRVGSSPEEAVKGARFVYTDVWASMGQESEQAKRLVDFDGYCVDEALMQGAADEAKVLHCLPAHRGEEISPGVIDGPRSLVWDQAENRLHAQKAILTVLCGRA